MNNDIAIIGLGVMGANFARNIASKGFSVSVYNRTVKTTDEFISKYNDDNISGYKTLEDLVGSLKRPRNIIVLVKSGKPVDAVIEQLTKLLDKGDVIIDLGNSNFKHTIRRQNFLKRKGITFVGSGLSGGEKGALHGPSIMPGGYEKVWAENSTLRKILEATAARDFHGGPCATWVGSGASGHYVKMIHNGIEYGIMQLLAETYNILRTVYGLKAPQIGEIFRDLNKTKLESFLIEISVEILMKADDQGNPGYLIDNILDNSSDKGTGRWTVINAIDESATISTIAAGVFARFHSSQLGRRKKFDEIFPNNPVDPKMPLEEFKGKIEGALYASILTTYAQGFEQITLACKAQGWKIDLAELARIWQGGCIIRAQMLETIENAYIGSNDPDHLFEIKSIQPQLKYGIDHTREIVSDAMKIGVPVPALASTISYFDSITAGRSAANFIQGLRDNFGSHTYERTDKDGAFHTEW